MYIDFQFLKNEEIEPLVTDPFRQTETNNWLLGGCSVRLEPIECLIGDIMKDLRIESVCE